MNEKSPQLNQEKNLALERQEAVKLHNEILKEQDNFSEEDRQWNVNEGINNNPKYTENASKMIELRKEVESIDKYRELAKSKENLNLPEIDDISDVEKIKTEKEKIDSEIEKTKNDIESTTNKLNELRAKLDMPPSEDIPSLLDKKENLGNLLMIQKDLENKLNFAIKKQEVNKSENIKQKNPEQKFLKDNLEDLSFALRRMVNDQDSFSFGIIATNLLEDFLGMDDLKSKLSKIVTSVEDFAKNGLRNNLDSLHQDAMKLSQIETSLRNLSSKMKNEEEKKEFGQFVSGVADKVGENVAFIRLKADRLQDYLDVK